MRSHNSGTGFHCHCGPTDATHAADGAYAAYEADGAYAADAAYEADGTHAAHAAYEADGTHAAYEADAANEAHALCSAAQHALKLRAQTLATYPRAFEIRDVALHPEPSSSCKC